MGKLVNLKEYKDQHKKPEKAAYFFKAHLKLSLGLLFAVAVLLVFSYSLITENPVDTTGAVTPISSTLADGSLAVEIQANGDDEFVFTGKINGIKVKFLFDTRADAMVIPEKVATYLRLEKGDQHYTQTLHGETLGYRTTLDRLNIGAISLSQIPATVSSEIEGDTILFGIAALDPLTLSIKNSSLHLSIGKRR